MKADELSLHGRHNLYNSMAAGLSACLLNVKKEAIRKALSDFESVEHRLERVASVRGVQFINDSKATNVNSCWYALGEHEDPRGAHLWAARTRATTIPKSSSWCATR